MSRFPARVQSLPSKGQQLYRRCIDLLLIVVLALAALKANWRIDQLVDTNGWDETEYLTVGLEIPQAGLPKAATEVFFAPLYSLWYLVLSQIERNPVRLVDFNFRLMAVVLPCILFAALRRARCGLVPSVLAAFFLIINNLSLDAPTRSIHFAVMCLGAGMLGALWATERIKQVSLLGLGAVAASFARPEYALLAMGMAVAALAFCVTRRFQLSRGEWGWLLGTGALVAVLVTILGAPIFAGNNRSFAALCQGFSSNYVTTHPSELNGWKDHVMIVQNIFGSCKSVSQAALNNPKMFFWHFSYNLTGWIKGVFPAFIGHRNFLLPDGSRLQMVENILLIAIVGGHTLAGRATLLPRIRRVMQQQPLVVGFAVCACLVSVLGVLLTLVQSRYFFPIVFMGLFAGALCLGARDEGATSESVPPALLLFGSVVLLGMTPASSLFERRNTSFRTALDELPKIQLREPTGYLEALGDDRMRIFLPGNIRFVSYRAKGEQEGFSEFMQSRNIGIVHVTSFLEQDRLYVNDPQWKEFLSSPEKFGFERRPLPWHEALYLKTASLVP